MKKLFVMLTGAVLAVSMLAGCGKKDPAYLSGIKAEDYAEPADYSKIEVQAEEPSVSDEYVNMYIQYMLSQDKKYVKTDRKAVQKGDQVNIDYTGKMNGKTFDGGSATDYDLVIGSSSFIDGFEDGLIGKKVGENVKLNLTFPKDYGNKDLAGKAVVFEVKINSIKQEEESKLDDAYVKDQNIDGVTTVDEYKKYVKDYLLKQAQSSYDSEVNSQIIKYLTENSKYPKDLPAEMVDRWNQSYTETLTSYAQQYGTDLENLMETMQGSTKDSYKDDIKKMAEDTTKEYLVMQVIADKEKLNVTDRDFNTALSTQAAQAGYSSVEEYKKSQDTQAYREYLMVQNVLKFLKDKVHVTAPASGSSAAGTTESAAASIRWKRFQEYLPCRRSMRAEKLRSAAGSRATVTPRISDSSRSTTGHVSGICSLSIPPICRISRKSQSSISALPLSRPERLF